MDKYFNIVDNILMIHSPIREYPWKLKLYILCSISSLEYKHVLSNYRPNSVNIVMVLKAMVHSCGLYKWYSWHIYDINFTR